MVASDILVVDFAQKDNVLKLYPEPPLLSSDRSGWDGIQLQYHRHQPHKLAENYSKQHRIIIHDRSPSPPLVEEMIEHRFQTKQFSYGDVTVVPADVLNSAYWNTEYEFITLSFEPSTFVRHTFDLTDVADVEFIPNFSKPDPLIHSIGVALKSELEFSSVGSRLYVDSLTAALMTHLWRHYWAQKPVSQTEINVLPKRRLRQIIDYIHQHLDQDLALSELAAIVQMSPSYFSSLFKQSTGLAPHQYVIQCRIERAKNLLLQGELTIAEVAFNLGFTHQSHLSRHFKRLVGVTPKAFLKSQ
ncbi:AraC family transcriptional regulator [Microcoleus sp. LAD1_D5]|uniref:AraC family transcriptional regulator n=1 Tax=unclassified Microcoleus TaxID=2642155 RepID=UPI002FD4DC0E